MSVKIDSRDKINYIRQFIHGLKENKQASNFIYFTASTQTGCFDFQFITRRRLSFSEIQKKVRQNKYEVIRNLVDDLRQFFVAFQDYFLSDDPIQQEITSIIKQITLYESQFIQHFKQIKPLKVEPTKSKKQEKEKVTKEKQKQKEKAEYIPEYKRSAFGEKVQMCYLLRAHEENVEYIRSVGEIYSIGKQTEDQVVIKLENHPCQWLQLLQKKAI